MSLNIVGDNLINVSVDAAALGASVLNKNGAQIDTITINAPAPMTQRGATVTPSRNGALTPTKHDSPMVTFPEITAWDAMKQ